MISIIYGTVVLCVHALIIMEKAKASRNISACMIIGNYLVNVGVHISVNLCTENTFSVSFLKNPHKLIIGRAVVLFKR